MIDGSGKRKRQLAIELRCKNPWKLYSKLIEEILHFSGIIYFTSVYFYLSAFVLFLFFLYARYLGRYALRRSEYEAFATTRKHGPCPTTPYNEPHTVFWKRGKEFRARLMSSLTCHCDQDN